MLPLIAVLPLLLAALVAGAVVGAIVTDAVARQPRSAGRHRHRPGGMW